MYCLRRSICPTVMKKYCAGICLARPIVVHIIRAKMVAHDHAGLLSDEALLHNIAHGCEDCFVLLYARFHRSLFSLSRKILRDKIEAEDVTQEVFLAIFEQREHFDPAVSPARTWILQFGYYKSLVRRRYLAKRHFYQDRVSTDDDGSEMLLPQPGFSQRSIESKEIVREALSSLSPAQRHVVEMVHFDGHTLREISEMGGKGLPGIRNSYYRGLEALRNMLGKGNVQVQNRVQTKGREEYEIEL
jgi:RNA polymerase sigma-70 factor (ECF subfamily)